MRKKIYCFITTFLLCCFVFSASSGFSEVQASGTEKSLHASVINMEGDALRDYLGLFEDKLLYMEMGGPNKSADYYLYDFGSGKLSKVGSVNHFVAQGMTSPITNNGLFFYLCAGDQKKSENILYHFDFSSNRMRAVSKNTYTQKLVPLTVYQGKLLALQGNLDSDGKWNPFFQMIDVDGRAEAFQFKDGKNRSLALKPLKTLSFANNGQSIWQIQNNKGRTGEQFLLTVYDEQNRLQKQVDITNYLSTYPMTKSIRSFYAFDQYFCITDLSNHTILCKLMKGRVSVLLHGDELEYAVNGKANEPTRYFFVRGTNDIYQLNCQTGKVEKLVFGLKNDSTVIRYALSYGDKFLVIKEPKFDPKRSTAIKNTETLYLIQGAS